MGIRGDLEARYWAEMGHEKPREMATWFFDCLKDPNVWQRMQREGQYTDAEVSTFLYMIDWLKDKMVTQLTSIQHAE